jgi:hypothetical protein
MHIKDQINIFIKNNKPPAQLKKKYYDDIENENKDFYYLYDEQYVNECSQYQQNFLNQADFTEPNIFNYYFDFEDKENLFSCMSSIFSNIFAIFLVYNGCKDGTIFDNEYGGDYLFNYARTLDPNEEILGLGKCENKISNYIWNKNILGKDNLYHYLHNFLKQDIDSIVNKYPDLLVTVDQNDIQRSIMNLECRLDQIYADNLEKREEIIQSCINHPNSVDIVMKEKFNNNIYAKALGFFTRNFNFTFIFGKIDAWGINIYEKKTNTHICREFIDPLKIKEALLFFDNKVKTMNNNEAVKKFAIGLNFYFELNMHDTMLKKTIEWNQEEAVTTFCKCE